MYIILILLIKKVNNFVYIFIVLIYNLKDMSLNGQNVSLGPVPNLDASIAQLVECCLGKAEVTGSIPVGSTNIYYTIKMK